MACQLPGFGFFIFVVTEGTSNICFHFILFFWWLVYYKNFALYQVSSLVYLTQCWYLQAVTPQCFWQKIFSNPLLVTQDWNLCCFSLCPWFSEWSSRDLSLFAQGFYLKTVTINFLVKKSLHRAISELMQGFLCIQELPTREMFNRCCFSHHSNVTVFSIQIFLMTELTMWLSVYIKLYWHVDNKICGIYDERR